MGRLTPLSLTNLSDSQLSKAIARGPVPSVAPVLSRLSSFGPAAGVRRDRRVVCVVPAAEVAVPAVTLTWSRDRFVGGRRAWRRCRLVAEPRSIVISRAFSAARQIAYYAVRLVGSQADRAMINDDQSPAGAHRVHSSPPHAHRTVRDVLTRIQPQTALCMTCIIAGNVRKKPKCMLSLFFRRHFVVTSMSFVSYACIKHQNLLKSHESSFISQLLTRNLRFPLTRCHRLYEFA